MSQNSLFALGLFIFGFTLMILMPASMRKNWKLIGQKPVAGDTVILMMRFMGIIIIAAGALFLTGVVDIAPLASNEP